MSDLHIREMVMEELDFEPSVNAAHIGVAVDNGIVTLSGHVSSYAEKLAAERAARRVKGVLAIAQEIEVRFVDDKKTADDEIAQRVINILRWNAVVPVDSVKIKVQQGWVHLSGAVQWQYQRSAAENAIRRLSGVAGVTNLINLKPQVQPVDVKSKIENALKRNAEIETQRIRITMLEGGRIKLEGYVHDWRERQAVESAAWSAPGVVGVEDKLLIA